MGCPPPDVLTFEEIQDIVKSFGMAAKRVQLADFDMVEIHACHGYLISNFLSPRTNKRTDWYGGSLENRMRFLLEVTEEIKSQVGPEYPICMRLSGTDYEPDGHTIELSKRLEAMGVAAIHMSGGNHHQTIHEVSPMGMSLCHNVWAAEAVKREVGIPVIASGSITLPDLAEEVLEKGKGDFIALGRPLWADPRWPQKAMEGRPEDIRPCIRCNDGCLARGDHLARTVGCSVNVATCREEEFKILKAEHPRKVVVIGAGLVGAEVGLYLAEQGKEVLFVEMMDTVLNGTTPDERQVYENRLNECNVSFHAGQRLESVSKNKMTLVDRYGARTEMTVDTIIFASGFKPERGLIEELEADSKLQVFEAGDCVSPRKIYDAIHDGHLAAKLLN